MDIQSREDYYDEPLLEYVVDFANKVFPTYDREGFYESNMPDLFGDRYVKGIIKPIGFDKYLDDKLEIQYTLDAFGLDSNKFWYLCLFLKDYVKGQTTNAIKTNPTHREELSNLLYELNKMNIKIKYDRILSAEKGGELSFKVEGGASKDKSFLISKMIYVLSISDDVKFITEYKDNGDKLNHLKNLLSRYKNIKIPTLNSIYW